MVALLEGAKLGVVTQAHREAAVSEWRRRSEKELKRKIGLIFLLISNEHWLRIFKLAFNTIIFIKD